MKNSWIHWIYKGKWLLEDTNEENHIHISFLRERNICFLKSTKPREIANMIRHSWNMKSFEELRAQVTVYLEIFQMTLPYACKQCKRGFRHYLKSMGWGSLISSHIGSVRYTKEARLVSTTQQYRCVHCDLKEIFKKCSVFIIGFQIFLTVVECLALNFPQKNFRDVFSEVSCLCQPEKLWKKP